MILYYKNFKHNYLQCSHITCSDTMTETDNQTGIPRLYEESYHQCSTTTMRTWTIMNYKHSNKHF